MKDGVARAPVAALPMYGLPELQDAQHQVWIGMRKALRAYGLQAPDRLSSGRARMDLWTDPALVLGQTCGLPYALSLTEQVELIGTPDYRLEGCPPGYYQSVILVRLEHRATSLPDLVGARFAVNERSSQSGYAALVMALQPLAGRADFRVSFSFTGSHAQSLQSVMNGTTDAVCMDAITWRLARRYQGADRELRPIAATVPTPGLPLIAARGQPIERIRAAIAMSFRTMAPSLKAIYGFGDMLPIAPQRYVEQLARLRRAEAVVLPRLNATGL